MQRRPLLSTFCALGLGGIVLGLWLVVDRFDPAAASLPELQARVKAVPDDPYSQRWLGRRLVESGDAAGGFDALAIASDLRPDDPQIRADTVSAAYRAHGLSAADAVATDFLGKHPGERLVTGARALAYATEGLGGELDVRRVQCLATALRLDPSQTAASRRLAEVFDENGFHRAARRILESAVKHDPDDVAVWHHLGRLRSTDDVPGAVEALRRAAELSPKEPTLRLDLASVLLTANRSLDADREFEQALQVGPEDPLVLTEVGKRWISQPGKLAAGEKLLGQLERAQPPVPEALAALGGLRLRQGRLEEADRLLSRALSGKLDDPAEALYALSRCAARRGDSEQARRWSRSAVALRSERLAHARLIELAFRNPKNPDLRRDLARSHARRGETMRAVSQFRAAFALAPKDSALAREAFQYERQLPQSRRNRELALFDALVELDRKGF